MAIEKYIAAASLGLYVMFVGEIVTIYDFMLESPTDFALRLEPDAKILQFISIGVAPAVILTGVSFIMSKRFGSKPIGTMISVGGIVLLVGMAYSNILVDGIDENYLVPSVKIVPPLFMGVSIPIIILGILLFRIKKPKRKKDYV